MTEQKGSAPRLPCHPDAEEYEELEKEDNDDDGCPPCSTKSTGLQV